jgi:hypothetical protein
MLDLCRPADPLISIVSTSSVTPMSGATGLTRSDGRKRLGRKKFIFLSPDEKILAKLGYRQEFKRAFSIFELFALCFSSIGVVPSIASVLIYAVP